MVGYCPPGVGWDVLLNTEPHKLFVIPMVSTFLVLQTSSTQY